MSQTLIAALQNDQLFDHPIERFQLIETHISWVILTGPYAYKIKKAHDFEFLDFSTLEKRKYFCDEELRLNQRLAADMYAEVLPITGTESAPVIGGEGPVIEYAIKMVQFSQVQLADQLVERGELGLEQIDEIAVRTAAFHDAVEVAGKASPFGTPQILMAPVTQNFDQIRPFLSATADITQLDYIENWANDFYKIIEPTLAARKAEGFVRECHGDLHLGNITRFNGEITLFDCIEFNESFRWIDVMDEAAFFMMDLEHRGLTRFANRFINSYLAQTGDYAGLKVLSFYKSYRAMVRAKVTLFRLYQEGLSEQERTEIFRIYREYATLAEQYTAIPNCYILMMHGYSGTGKSTLSNRLADEMGTIHLRSDVERKRLFAKGQENTAAEVGQGIYAGDLSDQTFGHLTRVAEQVLAAGYPVTLDATFLRKNYRDLFHQLAESQGVPLEILSCAMEDSRIRELIVRRNAENRDASDADIKVYEAQLSYADPLTDWELQHTVTLDIGNEAEITALLTRLKERCP